MNHPTTHRRLACGSADSRRLGPATVLATLATLATLAAGLPGSARAQGQALPRTNLLVEVRVVRAADVDPGAAPSAGRATVLDTRELSGDLPPPMQVRVANGRRGLLRNGQRLPVLWMDSVTAGGRATGAGASYQLIWLDAGQSLAVQPSWPGGRAPAQVELSLGQATLDAAPGKPIPARLSRQVSTTLVTPLARWTTIAGVGQAGTGRAGSTISTRDLAAGGVHQLLQLRVSAD